MISFFYTGAALDLEPYWSCAGIQLHLIWSCTRFQLDMELPVR